jgi:NAD(P)-binding Rossmann-like domain
MRLHFSHPPVAADENGGKGRQNHSDEVFLLMVLMLGPVIASLPPVSSSALLQGALWTLLALVIATTVTLVLLVVYLFYSWPKARNIKPMRAVAFQPELVPKGKFDTIVIGSGSGGSTCSNLLAQSGQRVLVLEQHPTVTGGCTHSFREQKCTCHQPSLLFLFSACFDG